MGVLDNLLGFLHTARLDAGRAYPESNSMAIPDGFHFLKIGVPPFSGFVVSMAHVATQAGPFPTDIAYF
jgi:hypothetical protein